MIFFGFPDHEPRHEIFFYSPINFIPYYSITKKTLT